MLRDLRRRFEALSREFQPNAGSRMSAWSLAVGIAPEQAALLHAAKTYVIQECGCFLASAASAPTEGDQTASSPVLSRFRFLALKMKVQERAAAPAVNSTDGLMEQWHSWLHM